jgi:[acyl-carrier-protein] S-malonyltransferase
MTAFLFPGQGSQYIGMASKVPDGSFTRSLFEQASCVLGLDLWQLVEAGDEENLVRTENTQPALFVTEMAWVHALAGYGVRCDVAAGHSLGEFAALCAAGVFTFEDGVRLVRRRGEIMAKAALDTPGTMAALVGLNEEELSAVLAEGQAVGVVEAANYNAADQTVVSGEVEAVERVVTAVRDLGHGRAIRLRVSAPFHSSIMARGSLEFRTALQHVPFVGPRFPVVNNVSGLIASSPDVIKEGLVSQFRSPVQWVRTTETFRQMGVRRYLEVGPKGVLAALARKAIPTADVRFVEGESWA